MIHTGEWLKQRREIKNYLPGRHNNDTYWRVVKTTS